MSEPVNEHLLLPVTIIGGYLGAGKTTLINALLRNPGGKRLAVLVNDFGEITIDSDLIESSDDQVIKLAGGCICCSIGSDLVATLSDLQNRFSHIDHVLLETSGVAMPGVVGATVTLAPGVRRDGVIVVCDALHGPRWLADTYVADTLERQIRAADCLVVSKQTLVEPTQIEQFSNQLTSLSPSAPQLGAEQEELAALLLGQIETLTQTSPNQTASQGVVTSLHFYCGKAVNADALQEVLANPSAGVFRAKGIFSDATGLPCLLQCVAGRSTFSRWAGKTEHLGHLIVIGAIPDEQQQKLETSLQNLGFSLSGTNLSLNQNQKTGKIQP